MKACQDHPLLGTWSIDALPANWAGWTPAAHIAGLAACDRGVELVQDSVRLTSLWQRIAVEDSPEHSTRLQAQLLADLQLFLDRLPATGLSPRRRSLPRSLRRHRHGPLPLAAVSNGLMSATAKSPRQQDGAGQASRQVGAPRYTTRHAPGGSRSPQQPAGGPVAALAAPRLVYPAPAHTGTASHSRQHAVLASLIPAMPGAARPAQRKLADLVPAQPPRSPAAAAQTASPAAALAPRLRDLLPPFRVRMQVLRTARAHLQRGLTHISAQSTHVTPLHGSVSVKVVVSTRKMRPPVEFVLPAIAPLAADALHLHILACAAAGAQGASVSATNRRGAPPAAVPSQPAAPGLAAAPVDAMPALAGTSRGPTGGHGAAAVTDVLSSEQAAVNEAFKARFGAAAPSAAPPPQAATAQGGGVAPARVATRSAGPVPATALLVDAALKLQPAAARQATNAEPLTAAVPALSSATAGNAQGSAHQDAAVTAMASDAAPAAEPVSQPEAGRRRSPRRSSRLQSKPAEEAEARLQDSLAAEVDAVLGTQADATFAGETRFLAFQSRP